MIDLEMIEIMKPDFLFEDERGLLSQVSHSKYNQVNSIFTKKGKQRGNFHYHKINNEAFFVVSGKIEVILNYEKQKEEYIFSTGDMFEIKKYVRHNFIFLEDTYLIGLYDKCIELPGGDKDIYYD